MPRFLRGLLVASAMCGVMGAEQSLAQEAERGRLSLPRGAPFGLPGGFTGMQAFAEDGTWTAPGRGGRGSGHALVLLCGAGGGGAGMLGFTVQTSGGGGGAGAAVLTTIPVEPGLTYTIVVGRGGVPGTDPGVEGQAGGPSALQDPHAGVLAQAGGGGAGTYNADRTSGVGGAGGDGEAHADGGIVRPGGTGGRPGPNPAPRLPGDVDALCATFAPDGRGSGGEGGFYQADRNLIVPGQPGQSGWALLIW